MEPNPRLTKITKDDCARWYRVCTDNGFEGTIPYVWLRDNCRCSECFYPSASQRLMKMTDLDPDVIPSSETIVDDGRVLRVIWPDQHRSDFQAAWLSRRHFSDRPRDVVTDPELQSWGAELNGNIPTFDFQKLLEDGAELYNWLDVPIIYLRYLTYSAREKRVFINGDIIKNKLRKHAFLHGISQIQMLHCLRRTVDVEGGENQFVDGLHVAQQIQREFPEAYKTLTTQDVDVACATFEDHRQLRLKRRSPTINFDKNGRFRSINYHDGSRAPYQTQVAVEQVTGLYRALKLFSNVMYRPENVVRHQLAEELDTHQANFVIRIRGIGTI
ncbi:gamma-butyrobetaine dioxygenase-like [Patiria miniata]|uniref:Gamma-butyrobetaine dioxygenase n=1 Tax=Patiria miniata TaxID=46514 RepID=A0A914BPB1_PATMI|nr:gamma-butyrobetaine dioxygenase-like [Patiria miniata]